MNGKLTNMDMGLPEQFLVHLVFKSLPPEFSTFEVNYNSLTEMWDLHKLVNMCVQEEERLKQQNGSSVNICRIPIRKGLLVARATKLRINMKVVLLMLLVSLRGKLLLRSFSINQTRN
jgi:hypothetical protein